MVFVCEMHWSAMEQQRQQELVVEAVLQAQGCRSGTLEQPFCRVCRSLVLRFLSGCKSLPLDLAV